MIFNNATNMMLGASKVSRVMCGSAKVWERSTPDTYRELEYIKSTGTQYIVTDFILNYTDKVVLDTKFGYEVRSTDVGTRRDHRNIFGYWDAAPGAGFQTVFLDDETTDDSDYDMLTFYIGFPWSAEQAGRNRIFDVNVTTRQLLTVCRPVSYWGTEQCSVDFEITMLPLNSGCPIFAAKCKNVDSTIDIFTRRDMYLYSFKVYDSNNALTHDLIPVERERDGAAGLYDRIENKFYSNLGTGEFVKGSVVEKYIDDGSTFEYGGFYTAAEPDPTKRGQPKPIDGDEQSLRYIRDLTYYEIPVGTTTLYGFVRTPIAVSGKGNLTLVYAYQYDENKNFLAQSWSGKDSGSSDIFYDKQNLPIPIDPSTKYIRISYGQIWYDGAGSEMLPVIPDPSAFDGKFIVSNVEVRL